MTCKPFCLGPFDFSKSTKKFNMQEGHWAVWYSYQCPLCGCGMSLEVSREAVAGTLIAVLDRETPIMVEVEA